VFIPGRRQSGNPLTYMVDGKAVTSVVAVHAAAAIPGEYIAFQPAELSNGSTNFGDQSKPKSNAYDCLRCGSLPILSLLGTSYGGGKTSMEDPTTIACQH